MDLLKRMQKVAGINDETREYHGEEFTFRKMTSALLDAYDGERQKRLRIKSRGKQTEIDFSQVDFVGMRAILACMVLVDEATGELAYDYRSPEHVQALNALDGEFLDWINDQAVALNPHLQAGESLESAEGN